MQPVGYIFYRTFRVSCTYMYITMIQTIYIYSINKYCVVVVLYTNETYGTSSCTSRRNMNAWTSLLSLQKGFVLARDKAK